MTVKTEYVDYKDGGVTCEAYIAYDDVTKAARAALFV